MTRATVFACLCLGLFAAGCAPGRFSPEKERAIRTQFLQGYVAAHPELPEEQRQAVLEDRIVPGMERKTVADLWGEPKDRYRDRTGMTEIWFYETRYIGFDKERRVVKSGPYTPPPPAPADAARPETAPAAAAPPAAP